MNDSPVKYGTIIADPPWAYDLTSKKAGLVGYSDAHYEPLSTNSLCALPVGELAEDKAVLLLWVAKGLLPDGLEVMKAWGFNYKSMVVWGKIRKDGGVHGGGVGYWFRGAEEVCLVGNRKGSYRTGEPSLYLSEKLRHSEKPVWLHRVAERHFPGPYLELFGRRSRAGWTVLGDEAPGDGKDIRVSIKSLLGE